MRPILVISMCAQGMFFRIGDGGMLNLLRRSAFSRNAKCLHKFVVPGRALETRIEGNGNTFILLNVHLHGLSLPQANDIADCLRNRAHMASLDPTGYFVSVLGTLILGMMTSLSFIFPILMIFLRNLSCPEFRK